MDKKEIIEKIKGLQEVYAKCPEINGFLTDYLDCLMNNTRGYEISSYYVNFKDAYKRPSSASSDSIILKNKNDDSMIINFCEGLSDNKFYISFIYHDCDGKVLCQTTKDGEYFMEQTANHYDASKEEVFKSIKNTKYSQEGLIIEQGYKENSRVEGKSGYVFKIFNNNMIISDYAKGTHEYTGEVVELCKQGRYSIDNMRGNCHYNQEWYGRKLFDNYISLKQIEELVSSLEFGNSPSNESVNPITF